METGARLDAQAREFLALMADAVFLNPFAAQRQQLLNALMPRFLSRVKPEVQLLKALEGPLRETLRLLDEKGWGQLNRFVGQDRQLMHYAYLLSAYLQLVPAFDGLIEQQLAAGTEPVEIPFAGEAVEGLARRGYSVPESLHYFALFFQFRRAFYFIGHHLVGSSPAMVALRCALWNSVFTTDIRFYDRYLRTRMDDFSTLLLGATGTGKGAAAAAVGRSGFIEFDPKRNRFSESFTQTFLAVNLSQFPETLIESELFGHRKGAFTGATDHHKGLFELCSSQGALFLDEIGDVSVPVQVKLLRVLENRSFCAVGSHAEQRFEGRVIAATNRPLERLLQQHTFREDLYYRLCSDVIPLPTLRQRCDESESELSQLVHHLIERILGEPAPEPGEKVLQALARDIPADYGWPGNVRELEQAVRQILLTGHYRVWHRSETRPPVQRLAEQFAEGDLSARELLGRYCQTLYRQFGSYEAVARRTGLDYRTVKKYVLDHDGDESR